MRVGLKLGVRRGFSSLSCFTDHHEAPKINHSAKVCWIEKDVIFFGQTQAHMLSQESKIITTYFLVSNDGSYFLNRFASAIRMFKRTKPKI